MFVFSGRAPGGAGGAGSAGSAGSAGGAGSAGKPLRERLLEHVQDSLNRRRVLEDGTVVPYPALEVETSSGLPGGHVVPNPAEVKVFVVGLTRDEIKSIMTEVEALRGEPMPLTTSLMDVGEVFADSRMTSAVATVTAALEEMKTVQVVTHSEDPFITAWVGPASSTRYPGHCRIDEAPWDMALSLLGHAIYDPRGVLSGWGHRCQADGTVVAYHLPGAPRDFSATAGLRYERWEDRWANGFRSVPPGDYPKISVIFMKSDGRFSVAHKKNWYEAGETLQCACHRGLKAEGWPQIVLRTRPCACRAYKGGDLVCAGLRDHTDLSTTDGAGVHRDNCRPCQNTRRVYVSGDVQGALKALSAARVGVDGVVLANGAILLRRGGELVYFSAKKAAHNYSDLYPAIAYAGMRWVDKGPFTALRTLHLHEIKIMR